MGGEVAQRGCGSLIPGGVQDPVGQGPGLPGLVGGIPVCGRRVGTKLSLRSLPRGVPSKPFSGSVIECYHWRTLHVGEGQITE